MARTTEELVRFVLLSDYDEDGNPYLIPFIEAANLVTTRVDTCASGRGITLSSDELVKIETWLAAHFYCAPDRPLASESAGGASSTYQGQTGMGLEGTVYGQAALALDYSGCLMAITKRQFARAAWLGKPKSEQTKYADRD